jgi:hypothetical protein
MSNVLCPIHQRPWRADDRDVDPSGMMAFVAGTEVLVDFAHISIRQALDVCQAR